MMKLENKGEKRGGGELDIHISQINIRLRAVRTSSRHLWQTESECTCTEGQSQ